MRVFQNTDDLKEAVPGDQVWADPVGMGTQTLYVVRATLPDKVYMERAEPTRFRRTP